MSIPEHVAVYRRLRAIFGDPSLRSRDGRARRQSASSRASEPYDPGRDPHSVGDLIAGLSATRGWEAPIARADLLGSWPDLVGHEVAAHATPVGIEEGVLTIQCDSTAWAQQLRLMSATILNGVADRFPAAGVETARFLGPHAPSWKHGPRAVPGRGPRDTYG